MQSLWIEPIVERGHVEFYLGYEWPVYDCSSCGCRFTLHDELTYDFLYSERGSCYNRYVGQAETCKELFDRGDREGLRALLSEASKYRFTIGQIDREPADARILEIGSSRGHLTSYFILAGRNITGVDVSSSAVVAASADFGNHFVLAGDASIENRGPYDAIFHVGTIGCIAAPIAMTRSLLGLLKTGGRLLFNAPNRDGFSLRDQLWFDWRRRRMLLRCSHPDSGAINSLMLRRSTSELNSAPTNRAYSSRCGDWHGEDGESRCPFP